MRTSRSLRSVLAAALVVIVSATALAWGGARADAVSPAVTTTTTVPSCAGMLTSRGLTHDQLATRYGFDALRSAGFDGAGATVLLIEGTTSVDVPLVDQFLACQHLPGITVHTQWMQPTSSAPVGNEATIDVETIAELLPGLGSIEVLQQPGGPNSFAWKFQQTLTWILDQMGRGLLHPDVISMSIGTCERDYGASEVPGTEALLQQLADAGVWFMKSAGDAGSSDCAGHDSCPQTNLERAVEYPTTSQWLTAVGGSEFTGSVATGPAVVWKSTCSGGGGGTSTMVDRPAWQTQHPVGGDDAHRLIPDITGLAGTPWYLALVPQVGHTGPPGWEGDGGTSLSTPMYASGMVLVRQALRAHGIEIPALLNPMLYRIATDPTLRAKVFTDVTTTDNDLYGVHCCVAGDGYDLASGWGELNVSALYDAIVELSTQRPAFTG